MSSDPQGDPEGVRPEVGPLSCQEEAEIWRKTAEEIFKELPPVPIHPLPKKHALDLSKYKHQFSCTPAEAWQKSAEAIEKHDAISCKAYREEIDTLLVFAGLFSAVVTAFTIESYQWLQDDPNDAIIALLSQIAQAGNQSHTSAVSGGLPDAVSARINAYWFLSLTLSLASALVAILCKQWVREFERRGDQSPELFISVRQTKLEGFEGWGVAAIVAAIPLILQSALALFAVGVIELLWELHKAVAIVVLGPTAAAGTFYLATTALPGLQFICRPFHTLRSVSQCPFKSPQSLLTLRMLSLLWRRYCSLRGGIFEAVYRVFEFFYRKSLVFYRRIETTIHPEHLPHWHTALESAITDESDAVRGRLHRLARSCHHFWRRMIGPWRYDEDTFYVYYKDRPTWRRFLRWWKTRLLFILCYRRTLDHDESVDSWSRPSLSIPHRNCKSWIMFDRDFTIVRDEAYPDDERAAQCADFSFDWQDPLPAASPFRGLDWLRNQTDHSGRMEWIWLIVWDIATSVQKVDHLHRVTAQQLRHGSVFLGGETLPVVEQTSHAVALALAYGVEIHIDSSFTDELFINILPSLPIGAAAALFLQFSSRLNGDFLRYAVSEILAISLRTEPGQVGAGSTFVSRAPRRRSGALERLGSMTRSELACFTALRFRERRSQGLALDDVFNITGDYMDILDAVLKGLAADQGSPDLSVAVRSTFSTVVMLFDQSFNELDAQTPFVELPSGLFHESTRRVYFDLLSPAPDAYRPPASGVSAEEPVLCGS